MIPRICRNLFIRLITAGKETETKKLLPLTNSEKHYRFIMGFASFVYLMVAYYLHSELKAFRTLPLMLHHNVVSTSLMFSLLLLQLLLEGSSGFCTNTKINPGHEMKISE